MYLPTDYVGKLMVVIVNDGDGRFVVQGKGAALVMADTVSLDNPEFLTPLVSNPEMLALCKELPGPLKRMTISEHHVVSILLVE